jgi:putative flippase GtrA
MEILVRTGSARLAEVTYEMSPREAGQSKASLRQGLLFARHLARLRLAKLERLRDWARPGQGGRPNELGRMVASGLVGVSGIGVNLAALFAFHELVGLHHLVGAALATQVSTLWNFLLTDALVYRARRDKSILARAGGYFALNNALLLARLPVLAVLVWFGMGVLAANALTLIALFVIRFFVSDRVIYAADTAVRRRDPVQVLVDIDTKESLPPPSRRRYQYLRYRYDIAGVVTIGSQIMLPELEFFRAQWVGDKDVDIAVRVGDVGGAPKLRASLTEYPNRSVLRYEEHLGRLGANFRIELGNPINIVAGPLLAASPHVVYTNIVEALLRFVMVSRGRMLLHSACVSVNGVGVMLSALTDTGKTATVLRILRDHGGLFLSDDMTLIDASGGAVCFPKPLTISAHTLRAVQAEDLTPAEWRRLQWQSRLHSKGGRSLALVLSRFNVPIMGINAITQRLVPPPKYSVDRLVPCRIGTATKVEELFIIERGAPRLTEMDRAEALERMIQNTDDAYGFPPFRYLAPGITINGYDYHELRRREREILAGFLSGVRTRVLASDTFGWADEIPRLIAQDRIGLGDARLGAVGAASTVQAWPRWSELPVLVGAVG